MKRPGVTPVTVSGDSADHPSAPAPVPSPQAANDLPPLGKWELKSEFSLRWGAGAPTRGAPVVRKPAEKSGVHIAIRVVAIAATQRADGIASGNKALPNSSVLGGGAFLEKTLEKLADLHDVKVVASCAVPLIGQPSETGSPRFRVVPSTSCRPLGSDESLLVAVVLDIAGDSGDISRWVAAKRTLSFHGPTSHGMPQTTQLTVRISPLATVGVLANLKASGTPLAHGTPMLIAAPRDASLAELQADIDAALGPNLAGILQMPRAFTAGPSQRFASSDRDGGEGGAGRVAADSLSLTIFQLKRNDDVMLAAARKRLTDAGFPIQQATDVDDLQLGGSWLAAVDPSLTVNLTGPAKDLGVSPASVRSLIKALLEPRIDSAGCDTSDDTSARQHGMSVLGSSPVLFVPASEGASNATCVAVVSMPNETILRDLLGVMTVPCGEPGLPLQRDATPAPRVDVRTADLVHRRRVAAGDISAVIGKHP